MSNEVHLGQVLDGRFHVIQVISRSGMASIFKATDLKTGGPVAVKVPVLHHEDPGFLARFEREETIGKMLDHPYILHLVTVEEPKSRPYIVMEYLTGETLRQLLSGIRPLPVADALQVASRLCDTLDYMHRNGVIHRDLKPENIMLCKDGSLRIMDFGIARATGLKRLTGPEQAMGTPDYMAPEQVRGNRGDERTDLYTLGAILYEMATGRIPFPGDNPTLSMNARLAGDPVAPRKLNPRISAQVEEIILHAMEEQPARRYPSARAMKAELDAPDTVAVTGRGSRLRPPAIRRSRWRMFLAAVLALLIPALIVALVYFFFVRPFGR